MSLFTKKFTKYTHYLMQGLVIFALAIFVINGNWIDAVSTAFIFIFMLVPTFLKEKFKAQIPLELEVALAGFVFLTLFLGSLHDYYEKFPWFDGVLHFQSGILLGMVGFVVVYLLNERKTKKVHLSPGFISFFAITFSMAVSVVWEVFEYVGDAVLGYNMQESGLPDTMGDLIVNATGAIIVGVVGYFWMKRRKKVPFTEGLLEEDSETL